MEVFLTSNRGWGVKAGEPITRGAFIVEYAGERCIALSPPPYLHVQQLQQTDGTKLCYSVTGCALPQYLWPRLQNMARVAWCYGCSCKKCKADPVFSIQV